MTMDGSWQFLQWHLDPVAIHLGPVALRWYGLMYVVAFAVSRWLVVRRIRATDRFGITVKDIDDVITWMVVGVLVGGRVGYALFYNFSWFSAHPLEIILPFRYDNGWQFTGISGMSYHGGFIGFTTAVILFARRRGLSVASFAELIAPAAPLGYMFGRIGNFLNGELWGRVTDVPWAMRFPNDPMGDAARGILPPLRHPSQLYEAFGEGLLLWAILWALRDRPFFQKRMLASYLVGYGVIRFFVEFTREPDAQLGLVLGPFSMGQVLCALMVAVGVGLAALPRRVSAAS